MVVASESTYQQPEKNMPSKKILWLVPVLALTVIGASCGKKVAEKATENAIKKATNGQADVDIGTNSVSINVNGSSMNTGDSVALPNNFPTDVYVVDGTIKTAISTPGVGYNLAIQSTKTVAQVKALYEQKLPTDGWTVTTTAVIDVHSAVVAASKNGRTISIAASDTDGPTVVTVMVTEKSTTPSTPDSPTTSE